MERSEAQPAPSIVRVTHEQIIQIRNLGRMMSLVGTGVLAAAGILVISHAKGIVAEAITRKSADSKRV